MYYKAVSGLCSGKSCRWVTTLERLLDIEPLWWNMHQMKCEKRQLVQKRSVLITLVHLSVN